jgi:hypothetical protein
MFSASTAGWALLRLRVRSRAVAVRLVDVRTHEDILSASAEASAAASLCAQDMPCLRAKITEQLARWMIAQAQPAR